MIFLKGDATHRDVELKWDKNDLVFIWQDINGNNDYLYLTPNQAENVYKFLTEEGVPHQSISGFIPTRTFE